MGRILVPLYEGLRKRSGLIRIVERNKSLFFVGFVPYAVGKEGRGWGWGRGGAPTNKFRSNIICVGKHHFKAFQPFWRLPSNCSCPNSWDSFGPDLFDPKSHVPDFVFSRFPGSFI